jgi:hypothetical protein
LHSVMLDEVACIFVAVALLWMSYRTMCIMSSSVDAGTMSAEIDQGTLSDSEADAANNQEGRRKRPCRCGACMSAKKRMRREE